MKSDGNGSAELQVAEVAGCSSVVRAWARSPLALLTPRARGKSVWAYTSNFGGGMVAGDQTRLDLRIDAGARCFLGTQASTKVYRNPSHLPCAHRLQADLAADSLLVLAPDPVQCFAESVYDQRQQFHLAASSNLVLVDWVSSGRLARGERWSFRRYATRNEIHRGGQPVFLDALLLDTRDGPVAHPFRAGRFNCIATVLLLGPLLEPHAGELLARVGADPIEPGADLVIAASPVKEGVVCRLAGAAVEKTGRMIHQLLHFVPRLLADDPWIRKW